MSTDSYYWFLPFVFLSTHTYWRIHVILSLLSIFMCHEFLVSNLTTCSFILALPLNLILQPLASAYGLAKHRDGRWEWAIAPGVSPSPRYQHAAVWFSFFYFLYLFLSWSYILRISIYLFNNSRYLSMQGFMCLVGLLGEDRWLKIHQVLQVLGSLLWCLILDKEQRYTDDWKVSGLYCTNIRPMA